MSHYSLISYLGKSHSTRALVVLAAAWECGPLHGAVQGGFLPL